MRHGETDTRRRRKRRPSESHDLVFENQVGGSTKSIILPTQSSNVSVRQTRKLRGLIKVVTSDNLARLCRFAALPP